MKEEKKYLISILRKERGKSESYRQVFEYFSQSESDTVAAALREINSRENLIDSSGNGARRIEWECSCLQKKCGACAMIICGYPRLACDAKLCELSGDKKMITVEPLKKFPVVCDLVVDRSVLYENLKTLRLWFEGDSDLTDKRRETAYEASECIQCGCCLEICPNFYVGGRFFGMSAVPLATRLLSEMSPRERKKIARLYEKHEFAGCGKSLACRDVCPKHIDTENLLVNANALAIWKRK